MAGLFNTARNNASSWFNGRPKTPEELERERIEQEQAALIEQSQPMGMWDRIGQNLSYYAGGDPARDTPRIQAQSAQQQAASEQTARGIDDARLRTVGAASSPFLAPAEDIDPTSPLMRVLNPTMPDSNSVMTDPNAVPPMAPAREIGPAPVVTPEEEQPVQVDATPVGAVASTPITAPEQQSPEQLNWINSIWAKMGADTDEKRQNIASALMRGGAAMMGHTSDTGSFWSALGAGVTAGADGYDKSREQQKQDRIDEMKIASVEQKKAVNEQIQAIIAANPNWQSDPTLRARVSSLMASIGDLDAATKISGTAGAKNVQFGDTYYDKAGNLYTQIKDPSTGSVRYVDAAGNAVGTDKIAELRQDSAKRDGSVNAPYLTPGETKFEEKYGGGLYDEDIKAVNGYARSRQALEDGMDYLRNNPGATGGILYSNLPESIKPYFKPDSVATRQAIFESVVGNLKDTFGGVISDSERQVLFDLAWNDKLTPEQNMQKLERQMQTIDNAYKVSAGRKKQYEETGYVKGWKPLEIEQKPAETPAANPSMEGRTGTTKDGRKVVYRNGRWVVAQ